MSDLQQAVLSFAGVKIGSGKKKDGDTWTRYAFEDSNGRRYATFNDLLAKEVMGNLAGPWKITWNDEPDKKDTNITYHNIANVSLLGEPPTEDPPADDGDLGPEVPWDEPAGPEPESSQVAPADEPCICKSEEPSQPNPIELSTGQSYAKDIICALIKAKSITTPEGALAALVVLSPECAHFNANGEYGADYIKNGEK